MEKQKWSKYYSKCGICGTTDKPHRTNGYCIDCYSKSPEHKASVKRAMLKRKDERKEYTKKYFKRPEVIKKMKDIHNRTKFDGNRQKVLERDEFRCIDCGLTQEESYEKYGKDLCVMHIGDVNNHSEINLITVCKGCFTKHKFKHY